MTDNRHYPAQPGAVVIYKDGTPSVIADRKADNTGWWLIGGGGLADAALAGPDWVVADRASLRRLFQELSS